MNLAHSVHVRAAAGGKTMYLMFSGAWASMLVLEGQWIAARFLSATVACRQGAYRRRVAELRVSVE